MEKQFVDMIQKKADFDKVNAALETKVDKTFLD